MKLPIVETSIGAVVFDGCQPKLKDRDTGEVKIDRETELPLWQVAALVKKPGTFRSEGIVINIPCKKDPSEGVTEYAPVLFKGLAINTYNIDGQQVNSYTADSMVKA